MATTDQRRGNLFALGLITGIALGASLALLFAPAPGQETRAVLREKGIELQARAGKVPIPTRRRSHNGTEEKATAVAGESQA